MNNYINSNNTDEHGFWWHSIKLPDGTVTPGFKSLDCMQQESSFIFSELDLRGKSVLDVGAFNGGFSVEAFRRGAAKVTALDHCVWNDPQFNAKNTIEYVKNKCNLNMDFVDIDLDKPQLDLKPLGMFDVTLFLGVFYHLVDPIAALREVCAITRESIIIETHLDLDYVQQPAMRFYPGTELSNDITNWWGPNELAIAKLLNHFGFECKQLTPTSNRGIFIGRRIK